MAANPVVGLAQLRLESKHKKPRTTVRVRGRITVATSAVLERAISDLIPDFERIELDISDVDYIDDFGLNRLVNLYIHAKKIDCTLGIANPKPRLRQRLRSWLHAVFKGHEEFLGMTPD
jgi:anti-anti-sigma factor